MSLICQPTSEDIKHHFIIKLSKDDKLVKNDLNNTECTKCAAQSCTKEDEERYVKENTEMVCKKCQITGLSSYGEQLAEEEKMPSETGQGVDTGKSSNSGATLSSSAVVVLLAVLKTAWAVST